tara:strand:- start:43 stop:342 length:300 start_codon:yes stop_codon:yes gene_type:complete
LIEKLYLQIKIEIKEIKVNAIMTLLCNSKTIVNSKILKKTKKYLKLKYFEFSKIPSNNIIKADLAIPEDLGDDLLKKTSDIGSYVPYSLAPSYELIIFG